MKEDIEHLFQKAYRFHVVYDKQRETIDACRKILELSPDHHNARLLLGITLAECGDAKEIAESREHFFEAIKRAKSIQDVLVNTWEEEDPIYQLAVLEWKSKHVCHAALFLLIDYLFAHEDHSSEYLFEILNELNPNVSSILQLILKRIKEDYRIIPNDE